MLHDDLGQELYPQGTFNEHSASGCFSYIIFSCNTRSHIKREKWKLGIWALFEKKI